MLICPSSVRAENNFLHNNQGASLPGIAGIINLSAIVPAGTDPTLLSNNLIHKICDEMSYFPGNKRYMTTHRGKTSSSNCTFCHVYLDTHETVSHKDHYTKDGILTIFNGSVSNLDELAGSYNIRRDDDYAQILYKLYSADAKNFYRLIKGSFSYILFDTKTDNVFIANDRFGLQPIYYFMKGKTFFFASEIKPLLATGLIDRNLNHKGCADFFSFGYVMQEDTLFEGIKLLPPATVMKYDLKDESFRNINYYNIYEPREKLKLKANDMLDVITEKFDNAVRRSFERGKPGFFLTAGVDSRTNIASAINITKDIDTFTYGIKGCFDEKVARKLSKELKIKHHFLTYDGDYLISNATKAVRMTDGMLNLFHTAGFPTYSKIAKISQKMVVGDGGEFARGFYHNRRNLSSANKSDLLKNLYLSVATIFNLGMEHNIFTDRFYKYMMNIPLLSLECALNRFKDFSMEETLNMFYLHERVRKFGTAGFLLKRTHFDIAYPFLDDDYIDILMQTPEKLKDYNCNIHVNIIKRLKPKLNKMVFEKTMLPLKSPPLLHFLGKQVVRIKKDINKYAKVNLSRHKPYLMFDKWLKNELKDFVHEILLSKRTQEREIYDTKNLKELYDRHLNGKQDLSEQLLALMTFEIFLRTYFD